MTTTMFEIEYKGYQVELELEPTVDGRWTANVAYFMTDDGRVLRNTGFLFHHAPVGSSAREAVELTTDSVRRAIDAGAV